MDSYDVRVEEDLGELVLVKIEKKKYWVQDDWYCKYITVKTPSGDYLEFPCFSWLVDDKEIVLRDGRGSRQLICQVCPSSVEGLQHKKTQTVLCLS